MAVNQYAALEGLRKIDPMGLPATIIRANLGVGNVVVLSEALNSLGRTSDLLDAVWKKLDHRHELSVLFEWPEISLRSTHKLSQEMSDRALSIQRHAWQWCRQSDRQVTAIAAVSLQPTGALFTDPGKDFSHCLSHWSFLYSKAGQLKTTDKKAKIVVITSPWSACNRALLSLTNRKPSIPVVTVLLRGVYDPLAKNGVGSNAKFTFEY